MTAQASLHAAQIAFIGPVLGSLSRPFGGWLSDRFGGGKVTLYTFGAMILAAGWLVGAGEIDDATAGPASGATMVAFVVGFIALFVLSGIGNGSAYKMIPSIFEAKSKSMDHLSAVERSAWSLRMSGALIGIAGAIGALGGVGDQHRAAGVLPVTGEIRDDGILGVPRLLRAVRGHHLVGLRAHPEAGARTAPWSTTPQRSHDAPARTVVVVGHGMVGHRFVEALRDRDVTEPGGWSCCARSPPRPTTGWGCRRTSAAGTARRWHCPETITPETIWSTCESASVPSRSTGPPAVVTTTAGRIGYDAVVLATGSYPFVPPIPGSDLERCFVYRTLEDLDAIRAAASAAGPGAVGIVVGGGLLGLEAANALRLLGMTPHVVEFRRG